MIPTNLRVGFPESSLQSRKNHKAKRSASYFMPVASISQTCRGLAVALCVGHGSIVSLGPVVAAFFAATGRDGASRVPGLFPAHANPGHVLLARVVLLRQRSAKSI